MKKYTEVAQFPSSSSKAVHVVKVDDAGELSCSCPSWKFNHNGDRTCKHTKQVTPERVQQALSGTGSGFAASSEVEERAPVAAAAEPQSERPAWKPLALRLQEMQEDEGEDDDVDRILRAHGVDPNGPRGG